ncbi:MAG: carboxylating nicotinate-nucleotide diphosphorylase [candidate division KSB1 bacterium]|nr:carboxylating nicotinate-nucleotide diphosphorylase [candidate division KSB1 bacterium]
MIKELNLIKNINFNDNFKANLKEEIELLIKVALEEDLDKTGDVTSEAIISDSQRGNAKIIAKQDGIFAGGFVVQMVFSYVDPSIFVQINAEEGSKIEKGVTVASISGSAKKILIAERTALNFLSRISGIATLTHQFVNKLAGSKIKILDTRKTIPGWRFLDKYAVAAGGGLNHRIGLFDMILIKENHIAAAGGLNKAVTLCKNYLIANKMKLPIEVETRTLEEVKMAADANVDRIMLDNMTKEQIIEAVKIVNGKAEVEVSGGVNLSNIDNYYDTKVNYISIGRLTHSAPAFDYSLLME